MNNNDNIVSNIIIKSMAHTLYFNRGQSLQNDHYC